MDDYALVLNAGSSSLKFCVFRRPGRRRLAARVARPDRGHRHVAAAVRQGRRTATSSIDQKLDATVRDGRDAIDALADWLRSRYGGARVLGVGHRVVHGGARFSGPTVVTPEVLDGTASTDPARSAASAVQPRCHRGGLRTPADVPAGRLLRHQLSSRTSPRRRACSAAPRTSRGRRAAVWLSWPFLRVHRFGAAACCARDRQRTRHRRAPGQRREPVRDERWQERR